MITRQEQPLFSAKWFRRLGIKAYPISAKTMELAEDFLQQLSDSLKGGYDANKPIIVSTCEADENLSGLIIDGRHRCYVLDKLLERGVPLPDPFPIAYKEVKDLSHLRILRATYESRNRSKAAKFANAWIEENVRAVVEDNLSKYQGGIYSYIRSLGFSDDSVLSKIVDDFKAKENPNGAREKKKLGRPSVASIIGSLPDLEKRQWVDTSVYAARGERLDQIISYHNCPSCKELLKITTEPNGTVAKIEQAPRISP